MPEARVRAGDGFSAEQRLQLGRAVEAAEAGSGLRFAVYVGELDGGRSAAQAQHAATADPARTVLVAVDPSSRGLEIVTGPDAASQLDDRTCALAALTMTSSFAAGDLLGGLRNGLQLLGDHARRGTRRHLETL